MNPSEKAAQNGTLEAHACPVCNTANEVNAAHCTTCAWYFPLKGTPQFAIELSRAKQQFQMVQSFNQVYQHMQIQSKVLEKMSYRLDGMEADMQKVKDKNFLVVNPEAGIEEAPYPELAPITSVTELITPEARIAWWNSLEEQWKKAFNAAFFQKEEITEVPNDTELLDLFNSPTLRVVGPRGMYPNITFELSNLSGVQQLVNLKTLIVTHCELVSLKDIEYLSNLKSLFANSNRITDIRSLHYLSNLTSLYCHANQINSLMPIKGLTNLEVIYCAYNQLLNFHGLTQKHKENLKDFFCLPNDNLILSEIERIEGALDIKCKKG